MIQDIIVYIILILVFILVVLRTVRFFHRPGKNELYCESCSACVTVKKSKRSFSM
jgi:hypothetical protein